MTATGADNNKHVRCSGVGSDPSLSADTDLEKFIPEKPESYTGQTETAFAEMKNS